MICLKQKFKNSIIMEIINRAEFLRNHAMTSDTTVEKRIEDLARAEELVSFAIFMQEQL